MLTNKWVITDKQTDYSDMPYQYTLVFVGEPNQPKKCVIRTDVNMGVGTMTKMDVSSIEPLENLYNAPKTHTARVELVTCRNFYKNPSIKVSLFGIDYGIFEGVIHNPQSNLNLTRGDIVTTALWRNPDGTVELHIINNLTTNTQYIYAQGIKYTQEMVVLNADMAGAFNGKESYKHLMVDAHSGCYSVIVPSTSYFFSVQEQDKILVLESPKDNRFEILDNKTINNIISKYVRQK